MSYRIPLEVSTTLFLACLMVPGSTTLELGVLMVGIWLAWEVGPICSTLRALLSHELQRGSYYQAIRDYEETVNDYKEYIEEYSKKHIEGEDE